MAVPTRYAALPYHFQLDEHGVRAGLVENSNTMRAIEKGRERKWGMHEKPGRAGEWAVKKKYKGKGERKRKGSAICICLISFT